MTARERRGVPPPAPAPRGAGGSRGPSSLGVAGRKASSDLPVVCPVADAETPQRGEKRALRAAERHAVLRPPRPGEARLDGAEIQLDDLGVVRLGRRLVEEMLRLAVRLDEANLVLAPPRQSEIPQRLLVDREEPAGRAVLGRHVADRGAIGERKAREALTDVLDELPDDARRAEDLRDREHKIGRRHALPELSGQLEAHDLRDEHRDRLAEHGGLRLDPADAPAEDAEPVHHRGVGVGADERVGKREETSIDLTGVDHAREVLEVDLVHDAGVRRDHLDVAEDVLAPAQEGVPLGVALVLELGVPGDGQGAAELVHLDGVVDDELGRQGGIDARGIAAELAHRVAHRGEVHEGRDAREVLEEDAAGAEGDLVRRVAGRIPPRDGADLADAAVAERFGPEDVLEQDPQRVRQPRDVDFGSHRVQPRHHERAFANGERRQGGEGVGHGHPSWPATGRAPAPCRLRRRGPPPRSAPRSGGRCPPCSPRPRHGRRRGS